MKKKILVSIFSLVCLSVSALQIGHAMDQQRSDESEIQELLRINGSAGESTRYIFKQMVSAAIGTMQDVVKIAKDAEKSAKQSKILAVDAAGRSTNAVQEIIAAAVILEQKTFTLIMDEREIVNAKAEQVVTNAQIAQRSANEAGRILGKVLEEAADKTKRYSTEDITSILQRALSRITALAKSAEKAANKSEHLVKEITLIDEKLYEEVKAARIGWLN